MTFITSTVKRNAMNTLQRNRGQPIASQNTGCSILTACQMVEQLQMLRIAAMARLTPQVRSGTTKNTFAFGCRCVKNSLWSMLNLSVLPPCTPTEYSVLNNDTGSNLKHTIAFEVAVPSVVQMSVLKPAHMKDLFWLCSLLQENVQHLSLKANKIYSTWFTSPPVCKPCSLLLQTKDSMWLKLKSHV